MIIKLSPLVRDSYEIKYEIEGDAITTSINDIVDTFDFSGLPDGKIILEDEEGNGLIQTDLPEVPILSAEKVDGELYVELLFAIKPTESDERLLFPEPMDVEAFNALMEELNPQTEDDQDGEV